MVSQFDVKSVPLFSAYDMGRAGKFHDKIPMKDVRVWIRKKEYWEHHHETNVFQYFVACFEPTKSKKKENFNANIAKFGKQDENAGAASVRASGMFEDDDEDDNIQEDTGTKQGSALVMICVALLDFLVFSWS